MTDYDRADNQHRPPLGRTREPSGKPLIRLMPEVATDRGAPGHLRALVTRTALP